MGNKVILPLLLASMFLTACPAIKNQEAAKSSQSKNYEYLHDDQSFGISVPANFTYEQADNDGQFFGYNKKNGDYSIQIYKPSTSTKCTDVDATILDPKVSTIDATESFMWGKVNNRLMTPNYPELKVVCKPQIIAYVEEDGSWAGSHAYALCSKKDNKTVLICISQMTDNPTHAEEIFKTFRWTKFPSSKK